MPAVAPLPRPLPPVPPPTLMLSLSALPEFATALAAYQTHDTCQAALTQVQQAFQTGTNGVHLVCISTDSLEELAKKNPSN